MVEELLTMIEITFLALHFFLSIFVIGEILTDNMGEYIGWKVFINSLTIKDLLATLFFLPYFIGFFIIRILMNIFKYISGLDFMNTSISDIFRKK